MNALRRNVVPIFLLPASLASWLFFAFVQLFWLPSRKRTFDEFGLSLPAVCQTAFQLNGVLANELLFLLLALFGLAVLSAFFILSLHNRSRILILCWILLLIVLPALISGCMILAVETVSIKLREGMSK